MKRDLYQEVTDRIIDALQQGTTPWVKPWKDSGGSGMPVNGATGHKYSGINVFLLWASPYTDSRWYSFKQAQAKHGRVRKGAKGTNIVFFKPLVKKTDDGKEQVIPLIRGFTVFNHQQIDWQNEEDSVESNFELNFTKAKNIVDATRAVIEHGSDRACYNPIFDVINMPNFNSFKTEEDYWATMLHELTHWTGHSKRKARQFGKRFGDDAYAMEELVAEMGAAFLCAHAEVEGKLQHAEYISGWLKILKKDKRAVFTAAKQAQQAADFVLEFSQEKKLDKAV